MQGADKPLRYYMQMGPDPKCLPLIDRLQVSCTTRILNYFEFLTYLAVAVASRIPSVLRSAQKKNPSPAIRCG